MAVNQDRPSHDGNDDEKDDQYSRKESIAEHEQNDLSPSPSAEHPSRKNASVDDEGHTYPEGGIRAWSVVAGGFFGMFAAFGHMNTAGTYQAYITSHQLSSYSESDIGWIFSLYIFLAFGAGVQVGPIFDRYGAFWLVVAGSCCTFLSMMLLGVCTRYWHFILVYGVLGGLGNALIFTTSVAAVGHYFLTRRGTATGVACCGGALGGVIFPLMLQSLFPQVGWGWATRIQGFIFLFLLLLAILLIRARLPPKEASSVLPDIRVFRQPAFALVTFGSFFLELGLFIPITYITSYSIKTNGPISNTFAYQILAIFNAGSFVGRWVPGYISDKIGRYNTQVIAVFLCAISNLALWLPAAFYAGEGSSEHNSLVFGLTVAFVVLMGFASGSNISLTPVCVSMLCPTQEYGRYVATCYTVVSIGCLIGVPVAGGIISAVGGAYWGVAIFTGLSYTCGLLCFTGVRVMKAGTGLRVVY